MTEKTDWRARIEAMPESAFPYIYKTNTGQQVIERQLYATRADMLAAYEWFTTADHAGKPVAYEKRLSVLGVQPAIDDHLIGGWWKTHRGDLAQTVLARKSRTDAAAVARAALKEKRAADKKASREQTFARIREDAKTIANGMAKHFANPENVDWDAVSHLAGRLSSMTTRVRFQLSQASQGKR